jgi:hypothetical protein
MVRVEKKPYLIYSEHAFKFNERNFTIGNESMSTIFIEASRLVGMVAGALPEQDICTA